MTGKEAGVQEFITYQQIYPEDCNPLTVKGKQMLHGGKAILMMDRVSALHARALLSSYATLLTALTVGVDKIQFHRGPACGEVLEISSKIDSLGTSRMTFKVEVKDEQNEMVVEGLISFCSFKHCPLELTEYQLRPHGIGDPNVPTNSI